MNKSILFFFFEQDRTQHNLEQASRESLTSPECSKPGVGVTSTVISNTYQPVVKPYSSYIDLNMAHRAKRERPEDPNPEEKKAHSELAMSLLLSDVIQNLQKQISELTEEVRKLKFNRSDRWGLAELDTKF